MSTLRLGAPRGRDAAPLVFGLDRPPWSLRFTVVHDGPAALAAALEAGALDLALVPAHAAVCSPNPLEIVPGISVCSAGAAGIARLVLRDPGTEVRRLASFAAGHAAEPLARLLFAESGTPVEIVPWSGSLEEALDETGAALLSGDAAREVFAPPGARSIDLGEAWSVLTGLPMVWSVWAARPGAVDRTTYAVLHTARTLGRQHLGVPAGLLYRLGSRQVDSILAFVRAAARHGLVAGGETTALRFVPLAASVACRRGPPTKK